MRLGPGGLQEVIEGQRVSFVRAGHVNIPARQFAGVHLPRGLLLRKVNNSGDIRWHKTRISSAKYSASKSSHLS